jgi:hypothetical protein
MSKGLDREYEMTMISRMLATLVVLSAAPAGQEVASVQFNVLNRWGQMHEYRVLHFRLKGSSQQLAPAFRGLAASRIPYGLYDYELVPALGDTTDERFSGSLWIYRDQIHLTRVLESSESVGHRMQLRVTGTLEPRPKGGEPVWVSLQSVYGSLRDESTVDDLGRFQLNYIWGNNVIIVCAGSRVLMSTLLNVGPNDAINELHLNLKTGQIETLLR